MRVFVNGVAVTPKPDATNELSAARELLRQRAVAVGLLDDGHRVAGVDPIVEVAHYGVVLKDSDPARDQIYVEVEEIGDGRR